MASRAIQQGGTPRQQRPFPIREFVLDGLREPANSAAALRFQRGAARVRQLGQGLAAVRGVRSARDQILWGSSLAVGGFGLTGVPDVVIGALYEEGATGLSVVSNNCGVEGAGRGILLAARRVARVTGSYVGENKEFARQYLSGELEVELVPQAATVVRPAVAAAALKLAVASRKTRLPCRSPRHAMAAGAALELTDGSHVNLGIGLPTTIPATCRRTCVSPCIRRTASSAPVPTRTTTKSTRT